MNNIDHTMIINLTSMTNAHVLKMNSALWDQASRIERQWIQRVLVSVGLLQRDALIDTGAETEILESVEIDQRITQLRSRYKGRCDRAYAEAMETCSRIPFPDQRKRFKNAAFRAYEMCMRAQAHDT